MKIREDAGRLEGFQKAGKGKFRENNKRDILEPKMFCVKSKIYNSIWLRADSISW